MHYIHKPIEKYGVVLHRRVHPTRFHTEVVTNLPHHIVYHSPDGFDWGYGGSGPAELALNLAERVVHVAELITNQGLHCTELAWKAKYNVKKLLIVNIPEEGMIIPWKLVCYAVMDGLKGTDHGPTNRLILQRYIDSLE